MPPAPSGGSPPEHRGWRGRWRRPTSSPVIRVPHLPSRTLSRVKWCGRRLRSGAHANDNIRRSIGVVVGDHGRVAGRRRVSGVVDSLKRTIRLRRLPFVGDIVKNPTGGFLGVRGHPCSTTTATTADTRAARRGRRRATVGRTHEDVVHDHRVATVKSEQGDEPDPGRAVFILVGVGHPGGCNPSRDAQPAGRQADRPATARLHRLDFERRVQLGRS